MSAPPYMQLYVADYTADVQGLTCEQDGAYWRLLRAMWRAEGKLPNVPAKLALIVGLPLDRWTKIAPDVLELFTRRGGSLTHKRITAELIKSGAKSAARAEAGKRGGSSKASKNNGQAQAIATILPQQKPSILEPELEPEREEVGGGSAREPAEDDWPKGDLVNALVEATASPRLDPQKSPGLITTSGRIAAWRREGASWAHDVLPVVAGLCAGQRTPISTWKFFDGAIGRAIADNRQALQIPEAAQRATGPPGTSFSAQRSAELAEVTRRVLESENG